MLWSLEVQRAQIALIHRKGSLPCYISGNTDTWNWRQRGSINLWKWSSCPKHMPYPSDFWLLQLTWAAFKALEVLKNYKRKDGERTEVQHGFGRARMCRTSQILAPINDFSTLTCSRCIFLKIGSINFQIWKLRFRWTQKPPIEYDVRWEFLMKRLWGRIMVIVRESPQREGLIMRSTS